jgi:hypothetical protein
MQIYDVDAPRGMMEAIGWSYAMIQPGGDAEQSFWGKAGVSHTLAPGRSSRLGNYVVCGALASQCTSRPVLR